MADEPELRRNRSPYRQILAFIPIELVEQARFEVAMLRARLRHPGVDRKFNGALGLLVNLGSGHTGLPGWVNVDGYPGPRVDLIADLRRHIPLPDGSARIIFTEHLVEHLDYYRDVPRFLAECRRVLQPAGLLRVIVPDGGRYLNAYAVGTWEALEAFSPLTEGAETRMEVINMHFRQGTQHRFSYDAETLKHVLAACGFEATTERKFRESSDPVAAIDSEERASESVCVEAIKPE